MFKAELKAETMKGLIYIVSTLVDEVKLTAHPDSIVLKAIDAAHVAMIEVTVEKEAFDSYEADEVEIGLELDKVKSALKLAGPGDVVSMEYDAEQGRLTLAIGNLVRRMSVVDPSSLSDPKVPQVDLLTDIKIGIDQIQKGIRAAETIKENHITLVADPEGFEVFCEGDTDFVSLKVPAAELDSITAESQVKSVYNLEYFSNIIKAIPAGTSLNIQLDTNYPVKLTFEFAEGHARVVYLLAPRIESE